jgi:hypothetical protein
MSLRLEPVLVAVGEEGEGRLAFHNDRLVAVLVRIPPGPDGGEAGWWFLEKGFGPLDSPVHVSFPDLAKAEAWLAERLSAAA